MARNRNTDVSGRPFAATTVSAVWNKGRTISGYDSNTWRYDLQPLQWDNNRQKGDTYPWSCQQRRAA